MKNNLIVNCSDVGIYLNEPQDCAVHHNTLYANVGIDVRFPESVVALSSNLLTGRIRERDGGTAVLASNLEDVGDAAFESWFADPARFDFALVGDGSSFVDQGTALPGVSDDFCGSPRDVSPDLGAVEYGPAVCDTTARLDLGLLDAALGGGSSVATGPVSRSTGARPRGQPRASEARPPLLGDAALRGP